MTTSHNEKRPATLAGPPAKVLVLEAGGIGDAVMATPALAAMRRHWPNASISVVVVPRTAGLVSSLGLDLKVRKLLLGRRAWQVISAAMLAVRTRLSKPDVLIDLSSIESDEAAQRRRALVKLIGAGLNVGRNTDGRGAFFDAALDESLFGDKHEVERKAGVLGPLGIRVEDPKPFVRVSKEDMQAARLMLAGAGVSGNSEMVGINPGAFLRTRRWPVENFERLASVLTQDRRHSLLVTGGREESDLVRRVAKAANGPAVMAVGKPLPVVAALIEKCQVFITNDTGMMHVAAARNVPLVALFGHSNLRRYRPCMPDELCIVIQQPADACKEPDAHTGRAECRRPSCPSGDCMKAIPFDSVHAAAHTLMCKAARNA